MMDATMAKPSGELSQLQVQILGQIGVARVLAIIKLNSL